MPYALIAIAMILGAGLLYAWQCQGERFTHLPFVFSLVVLALYWLYTPALLCLRGEEAIAGIPYTAALQEAVGVYVLGLGCFVVGYLVLPAAKPGGTALESVSGREGPIWVLLGLYLALLLLGLHLSGVPLGEWLYYRNSNKYLNLFGKDFAYHLPEKAADGLITVALLLAAKGRGRGLAALALCWLVFVLLGFRYRFLLTALPLLLVVAWHARSLKAKAGLGLGLAMFAVALAWLTLNRIRLTQRLYKKLDHNLAHFDARLLANEANNYQTFCVVLNYYRNHGIAPDYGQSSLGYILMRGVPSRLFPDGKKPAPPLLTNLKRAYEATPEGQTLRPALTNLEEYYLGGGPLGLVLGAVGMAWLCRWLGGLWAMAGRLAAWDLRAQILALAGLGTAFLFQLITRGWLPQQVDLALFLALPLGLLYLYRRYAGRPPRHHPA